MEIFITIAGIITAVSITWVLAARYKTKALKSFFNSLAQYRFLQFDRKSQYRLVSMPDSGSEYPLEIYYEELSSGKQKQPAIAVEFSLNGKYHDRNFVIDSELFYTYVLGRGGQKQKTDIQMNDRSFDDAALLTGRSTADVRALLHPAVRRRITEFLGNRDIVHMEYNAMQLKINIIWKKSLSTDIVIKYCDSMVPFIKLLSRKGKTLELLKENYLAERYTDIKLKYLESIKVSGGTMDADDEIIVDALKSRNPKLMFEAVKIAGFNSHKYIRDIFNLAREELRIRLLEFILRYKIVSQTEFLLRQHNKLRSIEGKTLLLKFYRDLAPDRSARSVQKMIENHGSKSDQFHRLAVRALGKCGDYSTISFLNKNRNMINSRDTEQAIAQIQERIGTGGKGWLSIEKTGKDEGALSIEN